MKKLVTFAAIVALSGCAGGRIGGRQTCVDLGEIIAITSGAMTGTPSFSQNLNNNLGGYDILTTWVVLTDANSSITRFDMDCTVSDDGNATDYVLQSCTVAAGVCTSTDATWQKATPGTANWPWRVDVSGYPDIECTYSVGAGAATAIVDNIVVRGRLCTDG